MLVGRRSTVLSHDGGPSLLMRSRRVETGERAVAVGVSKRRVSMPVALAACTVFVLFAALAGQATAGASMPQLVGTGSSYAGVAIEQWEGYFNETDGGEVNFTVSSSVIGLDDFCNRTVDFAAS